MSEEILKQKLTDAESVLNEVHELLKTTLEEKGYKALLTIEAWKRRNK